MTDEKSTKRVKRSESTIALIKKRALEVGQERSDEIRERVRTVMKAIEREMADNEGIYPQNKGALSSAEIARRAGVHPTTFFSPKQRDLGKEVKEWLEVIKTQKVIGRGPVRRELASRIADWKRLYEGLAQAQRDTELELQQIQGQLADAQGEIAALQKENARMLALLETAGDSNVIPLPPKKRY